MKICRDCAHCNMVSAPIKCNHPTALVRTDHVSSERTYKQAWLMRQENGACGPEAEFHTPHGPITRFLISFLGLNQ